ncbi:MAG TPA: EamA family transporter [Rariglobus sp.]|jgi:drug/metabolite transporter (DMT)-like permease|nr:EamA family transporter [Rariglobus sp.]
MFYLLVVSLLWAFSFGLIKGQLTGLDSMAVTMVRLAFALVIFLPFLRLEKIPRKALGWLATIGAIQFGLMYVLYLKSYSYLQAHEVALFTILTPVYVTMLDAALENHLRPRHAIAATLAVAGAGALLWRSTFSEDLMKGFFLVQVSNLCFAAGQIAYKRTRPLLGSAGEMNLFAVLMSGAFVTAAIASGIFTHWSEFHPTPKQWGVLAYLGALASGLGFFGWNLGVTRVNTGTLAAFNNMKIPLAVACSLIFFGGTADLPRLVTSLGLLGAAVLVAENKKPAPETGGGLKE